MKKLLLLLVLVPFLSNAQEIGVKVGPTYTVSTGDLKNDYGKGKVRFHAGVFTREDKGAMNFIFEVFYQNTEIKKSGRELNLHAVNGAFLLETKNRLAVQFGFGPELLLSSKQTKVEEYQSNYKAFNINAIAGVNFRVSERVGMNVRYTYGILSSSEDRKYHPMNVQLSFNYMIKKF